MAVAETECDHSEIQPEQKYSCLGLGFALFAGPDAFHTPAQRPGFKNVGVVDEAVHKGRGGGRAFSALSYPAHPRAQPHAMSVDLSLCHLPAVDVKMSDGTVARV